MEAITTDKLSDPPAPTTPRAAEPRTAEPGAAQCNAAAPQRAYLRISGQVQGVYYRSAATEQARVLGLRGVVRNLPSGEVELIAEGPLAVLQQLISWCHLGPPAARVDNVTISFGPATDEFVDFRVLRNPNGTAPLPTAAPDSAD